MALRACAFPVDIVQVLYAGLRPVRSYDVVVLQVLEEEDRYRFVAVDHGVLQDPVRRHLADSPFLENFRRPETVVIYPASDAVTHPGRGPGGGKRPRTVIWVPIFRAG